MNRHTGIRVLAGFMGVYHILMGILGIVSGSWAAWGAHVLWHANVTVDPQFSYLAKFLGAYVVAFGVMMLFITKDPVRYGGRGFSSLGVGGCGRAGGGVFAGGLIAGVGIWMCIASL